MTVASWLPGILSDPLVQLALATPAQFWAGGPFYQGAFKALLRTGPGSRAICGPSPGDRAWMPGRGGGSSGTGRGRCAWRPARVPRTARAASPSPEGTGPTSQPCESQWSASPSPGCPVSRQQRGRPALPISQAAIRVTDPGLVLGGRWWSEQRIRPSEVGAPAPTEPPFRTPAVLRDYRDNPSACTRYTRRQRQQWPR